MKTILTWLFSCLFILFLSFPVSCQIIVSLVSSNTCPGKVTVPLNLQEFNNVSSVSLKLDYDTSILKYDSISDLHPGFSGGMFLINAVDQQVIIAWFSLNPVSISNGTMLQLHFHHLQNASTTLRWEDDTLGQCLITDSNGEVLASSFIDASLTTDFIPPVLSQPPDQGSFVSINPSFHWSTANCSARYTLIFTRDPEFMSDTLWINNIPVNATQINGLSYNTTYYWKVSAFIPGTPFITAWSDIYRFTTHGPDGTAEAEPSLITELLLRPNPASSGCQLTFQIKQAAFIEIQLINSTGVLLRKFTFDLKIPGTITRDIPVAGLAAGLYLVRLSAHGSNETVIKSSRLIIRQ